MARSIIEIKLDAFLRKLMCYKLADYFGLYIVTEYPKSGGSWFAQMLGVYLGVPFTRNRFPIFGSQIMHGHYIDIPNIHNVFCIIRDGRDVMISYYFHSLLLHDSGDNYQIVNRTKKDLGIYDPTNIHENLPKFIEYKFSRRIHPKFFWNEFIDSWMNRGISLIKYEKLVEDTEGVLSEIFSLNLNLKPNSNKIKEVVEKFRFENVAGRSRGVEKVNSFLRKGVAGDWKEKFNQESKEIFNYFAGDMLIKIGYEQDDKWVNN